MTDPRIEQSLAEMIATIENSGVTQTFPPSVDAIGYDAGRRGVAPELRAWHARAMKLANEMEHYGHVTHYPAMCAKCRLLALLGDLK